MPGIPGDEGGREPTGDAGEAWRWGVEASQLMADRLLDLYREAGATTFSGANRDLGDDLRRVQIDMERWVDLSVEVFDRAFAVLRRLGGNGHREEHDERVSLVVSAGHRASGQLWIHNLAGAQRSVPVLRCPGVSTADGNEIAGSRVCFESDPAPLGGATTRRVLVVVDVPPSASPGVYHGQILSDASPDAAVALRVVVQRPEQRPAGA